MTVSSGPGHLRGRRVAVVLALVLVVTGLAAYVVRHRGQPSAEPGDHPKPPDAAQQLGWLVRATRDLPVSDTDIRAHFTSRFVTDMGGTYALNQFLLVFAPLRSPHVTASSATHVAALTRSLTDTYAAQLAVSPSGLIDALHLGAPTPTTWTAEDHAVRALAPQVSFAVERVRSGGSCALVHGLHAAQPRSIASTFKLYVLGALARQVATGRARWGQELPLRNDWKSTGSGRLQYRSAGTRLTLRRYAALMISQSDNTAADHLLHLVGRSAVQRQMVRFGMAHPESNLPFLTTRELFALEGHAYPRLADRYLAASPSGRARLLGRVDRIPVSSLDEPGLPRKVSSLGWFASPRDICLAFAGLARQDRQPRLHAVGKVLSLNDGGLGLSAERFPRVWYKGGSQLGVLALSYLVRDAHHRSFVVSVMAENPHQSLDMDQLPSRFFAIIDGALHLADPHPR